MNMKRNTELFDLYWEDILVSKVLPHLTIKECFNFRCASKTCLQIINIYFAKLKSLKLMNKGFSPHTFSVFAVSCKRLTILNLSRCSTVNDTDLIPMLLQNQNLTSLNLSQCGNLSAKCLQPVILYCNNLRTLKLARCTWLTTGAMEALALHQCKLEDVDLSYCGLISENCILIFIKKFRFLKTLNLEGNKQVTDKSLYAISKYSTSLKLLNLGGCTEITDKGVRMETTSRSMWKELAIHRYVKWSQNAHIYNLVLIYIHLECFVIAYTMYNQIWALALHSLKLEGLLIRGCQKVTENSLKLLRNRVHLDRRPVDPMPIPIYVQI